MVSTPPIFPSLRAVIFYTATCTYPFSANVLPGFGILNSVTTISRLLVTVGEAGVY